MFLIGGAGNGSKDLGLRKNQLCPGCKSRLGMQLIRTNGYIHLFFVPVFRYGVQYFLVCPACGSETAPGDRFCRQCGRPL